jgi:Protein of unknown function (DUF4230)
MSNEPLPPQQLPQTQQLPEVPSQTGWPDGPGEAVSASTKPVAKSSSADYDDRPPRRPGFIARRVSRWGKRGFWLASIAGVVVVLLLVTTILGKWPHLSNPFATRTTNRTGPVLLVSIQKIQKFEAATGNFQVVVDIQEDQKFIPDLIFNDRSLFVADGSVNASIDFSKLGPTDVVTNAARTSATITLPTPTLDPATLDLSRSHIVVEQTGLINKLGNLFGGDSSKQQELYLYAQTQIAAAAQDSQLVQTAQESTTTMLTALLTSLGFTTIVINFPQP